MKKFFSTLSSTLQRGVRGGLLFLALVATTALWAEDFSVDGIYYKILTDKTKEVEVTYRGKWYSDYNEYYGSVTIPSTVTYSGKTYSVTSIGNQAFRDCSSLTSVTIGNNVTSIGELAFWKCSGLTSIVVEESNTMYDSRENCNAIIETATNTLIKGCQNTIIPNSVTSIGESAFYDCRSLTSITIPESIVHVGIGAFHECTSLESVLWNAKNCVIDVEEYYISPFYVENSGYSGTYTSKCPITSFIFGNEVEYIPARLCYGLEKLTSIIIPNSVTSIGSQAFQLCSGLTSITIPNSVTSIGAGAFAYCSSLTSITIPNSVTSIGAGAFAGCSGLTSITIPNSVTSIGRYAFEKCSNLTSITIPNSVTSIGDYAFWECTGLTSVTIGNSVTSIGELAFWNCKSLTSVTIPNSVTSIGEHAFYGCSSLTSIVVEQGNTVYDSRENCNAIIETTTNTLIAGCNKTIIPNSVTSIGSQAFQLCSGLTSITIPNSVTSIGAGAFAYCSSLTSITIPNSVTSIGNDAFYDCYSLTSVTIGNSVTSIGYEAFARCSGLTSVTIGSGVTSIGEMAFENCTSLQSITCKSETPPTIKNSTFENVSTSIPLYVPCGTIDTYNASTWNYFSNIQELLSEFAIVVSSIDNNQGTAKLDKNSACGSIISAIANTGYHFTQWSDGNLDNPRTFIPTQDTTFIAEFAPNRHTVSIYSSDSEQGSVSGSTTANYGSYVTIRATANYGYHFTCWDDGNTNNPRQIQVTKDISFTAYFDKNTYHITKLSNSEQGYIDAPDSGQYLDKIILTATPKHGYRFTQWGDGLKNNPRALLLTQDTIFKAEFALVTSGQCGYDLYWSYDLNKKTISITGKGEMYDYTTETQPWAIFREEITAVYTENTVSSIGTSAFKGCTNLGKISIGGGLEKIADNAFANCSRLYDIECYAVMPPASDISSFINYNAFVTVLCDSKRLYEADMVWGNFRNLDCIGAESENMGGDDVVITPGSTDVTITWPTENNADTYTIVITKDGEVVCTLTFNSNGQLLNIAFAPGRNGNNRTTQYATQTINGLRFTITGLNEGTHYTYDITAKDTEDNTLQSHSGEFTTQSNIPSSIDNTPSPITNTKKILRNGQLLIIRDGKTYNAMGQEL